MSSWRRRQLPTRSRRRRFRWSRFRRPRWRVTSLSTIGADVEFIDIVDVDRHHLRVERAVAAVGSHRDVVTGASASRSSAPSTVTTPVDRVDRESSTVVIVQRIGDRVVGRVGVAGQRRDRRPTFRSAAFSSTALAVASLSVIAPTSNSSTSLMLIVITGRVEAAVAAGRSHRDVVAGRRFAIQQRAVGDGDHTG